MTELQHSPVPGAAGVAAAEAAGAAARAAPGAGAAPTTAAPAGGADPGTPRWCSRGTSRGRSPGERVIQCLNTSGIVRKANGKFMTSSCNTSVHRLFKISLHNYSRPCPLSCKASPAAAPAPPAAAAAVPAAPAGRRPWEAAPPPAPSGWAARRRGHWGRRGNGLLICCSVYPKLFSIFLTKAPVSIIR